MFELIMLLSFLACSLLPFLSKDLAGENKSRKKTFNNRYKSEFGRKTRKPGHNMRSQPGLRNSRVVYQKQASAA